MPSVERVDLIGREGEVVSGMPLEDFLRAFAGHVRRFRAFSAYQLQILIGSSVSKPKYIFSDGEFRGIKTIEESISTCDFEGVTYVGWVGESKWPGDSSNLYLQSALKVDEVRKLIKDLGLRMKVSGGH